MEVCRRCKKLAAKWCPCAVAYCSESCQKADWTLHKTICQYIEARGSRGSGHGGGGGEHRRSGSWDSFSRREPIRRSDYYPRGGHSSWRFPWYSLFFPSWYTYATPYYDSGYPVYPMRASPSDQAAVQYELERLRAENASLRRDGQFELVPDTEGGQYHWIRRG